MEIQESNSDRYTFDNKLDIELNDNVQTEPLTPGQKGVTRRYTAVAIIIYSMLYGGYSIIAKVEMNEIFISTMIGIGGALLGIGRIGKNDK
jgi:hypothetical protein